VGRLVSGAPSRGVVLVVDDNRAVCTVFQRLLERMGYEAIIATNAGSALACLAERRVDVMLLDVHLGEHKGDSLCLECMHRWPYLANRVVIVSGDLEAVAEQWPPQLRALPTLSKPFRIEELEAVLALAHAAARAASQADQRREGSGP
jgi:DNA-binding NtrC family response regulator